ncbi:hypothetical protein Acsp02_35230 [Actinoplanes sp. NBRC 103695]|nr:hypothetical protein Acsp02_35230 [Actinoplanes sp. NBRC 103695]
MAVDGSVGVSAREFAAGWVQEPDAVEAGPAVAEELPEGAFLPGVTELVVVPLAVNLAAAVVYDVVRRVVSRASRRPREVSEIEIAEVTTAGGDRVIVVRAKRDLS